MADFSPTGLRVLREVAQTGSFTAAARSLGYTQSAISRQVAALEAVAGVKLFERSRSGVTPTTAGARLLPRANRILDELDAARREATGTADDGAPVRLGAFPSAAAGLVPRALAGLPRELRVTLREGTTPQLTRALRAGTLDLAVLARTPPYRPPDGESPPLMLTTLFERDLLVAVPAGHPLAGSRTVDAADLRGQTWIASSSDGGESLLGAWPGLTERPDVRYVARDWLAKLQLVAAGLAITTVAPVLLGALPPGVAVVAVRGEPRETRRIVLARRPGRPDPRAAQLAEALVAASHLG